MSLDLTKLEKARIRGGKLIARCPVCARGGGDKSGEHLACWSTDGDGPFRCVCGCDNREIFRLVGKTSARPPPSPRPPRAILRPTNQTPPPRLPPLREPTLPECFAIARLRDWQFIAGIEFLVMRKLLWYADVWDDGRTWPAWVVADSSRRNAQARKFDGSDWHGIHGAKAKSLPGSKSEFLIGACDVGDRPIVALCEGQPDFVAALGCVWFEDISPKAVAPVCVTGTGNKEISASMLPCFQDKIVVIPVHNDADGGGRQAAEGWSRQLSGRARSIEWIHFDEFARRGVTKKDGRPIKDLADWHTLLGHDEDNDLPLQIFSSNSAVVTAAKAYAASHPNIIPDAEIFPF